MRLRLAHFSIKEYLVSHRITQGPAARFGFREGDAHLHIARCCLAYHLQRDAVGVRVKEDEELEGHGYQLERHLRSSGYWLGMYAAANWPVHLEMVPRERWPPDVCDAAARALAARSPALLETLRWGHQARGDYRSFWRLDLMRRLPLQFTAYFGFVQLTDMLISSHTYLIQEDLDHALEAATDSGHNAVINLLLDKGARVRAASVDMKTEDGGSRYVDAVIEYEIDSAVVEMDDGIDGFQNSDDPLDAAAEVIDDTTDGFNLLISKHGLYYRRGSALQRACHCEDSETVQLLLDGGANVNARGGYFGTALQAACARYPLVDLGLVTLLLESGADVNAQGGEFGNALQASCYNGHEMVIATLLEAGADINAFGGAYGSALQAALSSTLPSTVLSMLLRNGADVNQRGGVYGFYGTPLKAALAARHDGAELDQVIILLDHGADVNTEGGHYGTALVVACSGSIWNQGSLEVALLLLRRGASAHAQGGHFGSAWHAAAAKRNHEWEDVLQRMLDGGVDINNAQGQQYATALEAALIVQRSETAATDRVRFLLDRGADVNVRGGRYGFPLLEHGADVNLRGGQHRSALNAAIFRHFWDIVEILLEAGATPDCQLQPEPDEEFLARVREELKGEGQGAVERYCVFWEKHKVK